MIPESMQDGTSLLQAYQRGQMPPKHFAVDEWADEHRYINEVTGRKWKTSYVEVARGPMRSVTEPGVRTITVMACTQLLKTELILNTIGYFMDVDPCPMLVVQPKEEVAKKFSSTRLTQMIRATPRLRDKISSNKLRDATNTAGHKEFPGGHITIVSARAPSNLAMLPIRIVLLDEIDKYESDAGDEGDPVALAEERMATYSTNSLSIRVCSPTVKGDSRIEKSYESSDQRKPFVCCPHCDSWQLMLWANVHWEKDDQGTPMPETAEYTCRDCGAAWSEAERLKSLKSVSWRVQGEFRCKLCGIHNTPATWDPQDTEQWDEYGRAHCEGCGHHSPNSHAGYGGASKLYSPHRPLSEMVEKWIEAQGNIELLKTFINTQLAETFEETGERIEDPSWLMQRREQYDGDLPSEVGIITAGVDVQQNRLEMEVVGWGVDEESWSLKYMVLPGDPSQPEVWEQLDAELNKPFTRADGRISYIAAACVDMQGGFTQEVANFCRTRINRRIWPIRGIGGDGRPNPVWPRMPKRTSNTNVPYYNIGTDSAKNVVYARLLIGKVGPGYCHFPLDREEDWFKQLTAEKRMKRYRGTQKYYRWENPQRARNEGFDNRCYAYAALCGLQSLGWKVNIITEEQRLIMDPDFEQRRQERLDAIKTGETPKAKADPGSLAIPQGRKPQRKKNRSAFMDK